MEAELQFYLPRSAPRELLEAAARSWPDRKVLWLARLASRGRVARALMDAIGESEILDCSKVGKLILPDGSTLEVGLASAAHGERHAHAA